MNTYIIPICDTDMEEIKLKKISANSLNNAEQKFVDMYRDKYDADSFDELLDLMYNNGVLVGEILDIETL